MSNKAIFLDREDTLIEDPGYINHPDQVRLLDGAAEALIELRNMGYRLVVATNQSGVARGIVSEGVLGEIHDRLKQLLAEKGAFVDQIYYCPYHPEGVIPKYRRESEWRKPRPGMLLTAAEEMDIDLCQSWVIGNGSRDVEAGLRAGCQTILIERSYERREPRPGEPAPHYKSVNIKEAVNIIKKHLRSARQAQAAAPPGPCDADAEVGGETERVEQGDRAKEAERVEEASVPAEEVVRPAQQATAQQTEPPEEPAETGQAEAPAEPAETEPTEAEQTGSGDRNENLLRDILEQLKRMQRAEMFGEFSTMRFAAGVVQVVVLFCVLVTVWLLVSPQRRDSDVLIALGFAAVLQLMALTFFIMHGRK